jgi:hypothetical protein
MCHSNHLELQLCPSSIEVAGLAEQNPAQLELIILILFLFSPLSQGWILIES